MLVSKPDLRDLSQSTRRSVWHLRRRVAGYGRVALEEVRASDIENAFADLNHLHRLRWGKPAFAARRLQFHSELARRLVARGSWHCRVPSAAGRCRSSTTSASIDRQYNIKMAFDPPFSSQISLGLIHLGYAMEAAANRGDPVTTFWPAPVAAATSSVS